MGRTKARCLGFRGHLPSHQGLGTENNPTAVQRCLAQRCQTCTALPWPPHTAPSLTEASFSSRWIPAGSITLRLDKTLGLNQFSHNYSANYRSHKEAFPLLKHEPALLPFMGCEFLLLSFPVPLLFVGDQGCLTHILCRLPLLYIRVTLLMCYCRKPKELLS